MIPQQIYNAVKNGIDGFSKQGERADETRQRDAIEYYREYPEKFKIITEDT
jgi:hypothetical protein